MSFIRWSDIPTSFVSWAAGGFLMGVLLHAAFPFDSVSTDMLTGLGVALVGAVLIPWRIRWGVVVGIVGVAAGLWRFDLTFPNASVEPPSEFTGMVIAEGRYDVLVQDEETGLVITVGKRLRIADRVRISCARVERIPPDPKSIFDARKNAWFKCKGDVTANRISRHPWNLHRLLAEWRLMLTQRIQGILPGDAGALLSGILYGERGLSANTSATFKTAGMTHLIAVSGSNIAIVISLFVPCFLCVGYRRKPAIVLSGLAVSLFVVFVGAQASVVRAALMGWMGLLARVFGRKASAERLLAIAATCIVLFDPWALAFDAGFALSFLATWGLLRWSRPFQEHLRWMPEFFGLREAAATTLAATLVTFPYALWAFGTSSLIGLLTNLFAVPIGGLAMLWGAVAVLLGPFISIAALPAQGCLEAMLLIARMGGFVPWLQLSWALPTWGLFFIYGLMGVYSWVSRAKNNAYPQSFTHEHEISPFLRRAVTKG